jgi:uncharacterized protein YndB with AHSA1/START domain
MADAPTPDGETTVGMTMTRTFEASRERVWREWTQPECFADWFGGTQGQVPIESVSMDVRPGGSLRLTMIAGPQEIQWKGEYIEVHEPERLVFKISDQPGDERYEEVSVVLTEVDDGRTEMLLQQRGHMTPEQYERAGQGWAGFLDRMAERLAEAGS